MSFEYTVRPPGAGFDCWRFLEGAQPAVRDLWSNFERGRPRVQKQEDAAVHRGISVWRTPDQARSVAERINPWRVGRGFPPWTHIGRVLPDGPGGHVYAEVGSEGHLVVWGEADELASTITLAPPIMALR